MSIQNALASWKSTVSSLLTTTLATSAAFLAPPLNSLIAPKHVLWLGAFQVVGKIWIGIIQKDPDTVLAKVPGIKEPQLVSAHGVPDDPKAVPVVQK